MKLKVKFLNCSQKSLGLFTIESETVKAVYGEIDRLMHEFCATSGIVSNESGEEMFYILRRDQAKKKYKIK